jgi:hypothetical protein
VEKEEVMSYAERDTAPATKLTGATLDAPFPWFGGKRRVAAEVWARFGNVANYIEPFFGSGAVLLGRPDFNGQMETVNDLDGFVANFWRAIKHAQGAVAEHADNPVNENDLHARHIWLVQRREELRSRLEGDPDFFDAQIAGYWVWGISCWIGSGFCSGNGPWGLNGERQLVHLGNGGQGVNRKRVHLGNGGQGVNRKLVHLGNWFAALAHRLDRVRVASGDWSRVCGPSVLGGVLTGVFLDPPYADTADRNPDLYAQDSLSVAHDVREWAIENGKNTKLRIALCGYDGEHVMPDDWSSFAWKTQGGYGCQGEDANENSTRERVWFSPACLSERQVDMFKRKP